MVSPGSFEKRILVAACGMTPQIVTETLHALRVTSPEQFPVTEIRLVTTLFGREQALNTLIGLGKLRAFCAEYGFEPILFDADCIEVIRDREGRELPDIQTPEHNRCAADCITEVIRRLTAEPDTALHVSLAGGRKTMGYYIGYALSLFGRQQDRLSHVLVDEGYEGHMEFFYPTRNPCTIRTHSGLFLDTSRANVMLAEIPFVRLRDTLPSRLLESRASFSEAVMWSNLDQEPLRLELDHGKLTVRASGQPIALSAKEFAMYAAFARAARDGEPEFEGSERNMQLTRAFLEEFARGADVARPAADLGRLMDQLEDAGVDIRTMTTLRGSDPSARNGALTGRKPGIGVKYFGPVVSKINRKLSDALGERLAASYRVRVRERVVSGKRRVAMYGVALEPNEICVGE